MESKVLLKDNSPFYHQLLPEIIVEIRIRLETALTKTQGWF